MTIRLKTLERQARMVGGDGGKTHGWLQSWLVKDARAREGVKTQLARLLTAPSRRKQEDKRGK